MKHDMDNWSHIAAYRDYDKDHELGDLEVQGAQNQVIRYNYNQTGRHLYKSKRV